MTVEIPISVAIPTYRREQVLIDSIERLLRLKFGATEILVVDQSPSHLPQTEIVLQKWNEEGAIRWIRLRDPSIPGAMNRGLVEARHDVVLFLDDDIVALPNLVRAHAKAHREGYRLVAGRVLQPWDNDNSDAPWDSKQFASTESRTIEAFMGGNFSLRRRDALALGGFDENFVRAAYNFELEFADRWRARGGEIHYCPSATIRHLKAASGGTRTYGEHLTTLFPAHSVGAYYYLLRSKLVHNPTGKIAGRLVRSIMTRHHLRRPWWIPVTLVAELTGLMWAVGLRARGPRYCAAQSMDGE